MPPKIIKPDSIRDLGVVEADRLISLAARVSSETWGSEDQGKENNFPAFHHTQHIIFSFIRENRDPEDYYANPAWEMWKPVLLPVMQAAIAPYGFRNPRFPKAMLAKLAAGHQIDLHFDGAGSNRRVHEIHVPLITNPGAQFLVGENRFHLEAGRAYEVNNIVAHGAANHGSEDRIHFIFEVFEGDYANSIIPKVWPRFTAIWKNITSPAALSITNPNRSAVSPISRPAIAPNCGATPSAPRTRLKRSPPPK